MLVPDVNVLVYAHRPESPRHEEYLAWLSELLAGPEPVGMSELVLSGFIRVVTHHRVFREPTPTRTALAFCDAVLASPSVVPLRPGPRHWALFSSLCTGGDARGNLVPDAYHAALAMEHGATWVTTDKGFARFPRLRTATPLE